MILVQVAGLFTEQLIMAVAINRHQHIARQIPFDFLAAVGVGDLFHIADITGHRGTAAASVGAQQAGPTRTVLEADGMAALADLAGLVEGGVQLAAVEFTIGTPVNIGVAQGRLVLTAE